MKNVLVSFFFAIMLFSCQKEEIIKAEPFPQTWQLVKLMGELPNSTTTGIDLPWQETYVFNADSTFLKTRQQGNQITQARGTFSFREFSDGRPYAVLTYDSMSSIIASCTTAELKETLAFKTKDILLSTWMFCDGPGLEYAKMK